MNSITAIIVIVVLLACLVCYAFLSQALEQRRQHRQRLLAALQVRAANFKFMLNSLPAGYLTRELTLLVQRTLIEVCERMVGLDPKNPAPKQDLQQITQQLAETRRTESSSPGGQLALESIQQVRDIKQCLEELFKVVQYQEARGQLDTSTAEVYRSQIRMLLLGLTVDAYILQGLQARSKEKLRLAQHYFELALKLLAREDATSAFHTKQQRLRQWLKELEEQARQLGTSIRAPVDEHDEQAEIEKAWEKFSEAEQGWKKKNVYD